MHTHSYFELLLVTDDTYTCYTENGDIPIQAGELLIVKPSLMHRAFSGKNASHIAVLGISLAAPHGKGHFYDYFTSFLQTYAGTPLRLRKSVFHKFVNYSSPPPVTRYDNSANVNVKHVI